MTQTTMTEEKSDKSPKDVKVSLKRKSIDKSMEEQTKKLKTEFKSVRSRINADQALWNQIPILKEDVRTSGIIPRLEPNFKKGDTLSAYLCSPLTDHLATEFMDLGWGCGYRNCQMLMTFLERQIEDGEPLLKNVLDIDGIQLLIERAWKEGFDSLGATQLDNQVFKTRKWIGTTEVYTLFTYLGIRSTIIDFHHPGPKKLHHELMDWIQSYFMESSVIKNSKKKKTVYITNRPPLYLQHQGHSRTVVGIEILKTGKRNLIMFDPGRRTLRSYLCDRHKKEQEENPSEESSSEEEEEEEEEIDILSNDDYKKPKKKSNPQLPSSLLKPHRVDDKAIGKHRQYQILVLGHVNHENGKMSWDSNKSYLLNEVERESMKTVTSLAVL